MSTLKEIITKNVGKDVATDQYLYGLGYDSDSLNAKAKLIAKFKNGVSIYATDVYGGYHISYPIEEKFNDDLLIDIFAKNCADKWDTARHYIKAGFCSLSAGFNRKDAHLPKSAIYDAIKSDVDSREFSASLAAEALHHFKFDEFSESAGYYVFDDGSLYGYNGGDPIVYADYKDFVEDVVPLQKNF